MTPMSIRPLSLAIALALLPMLATADESKPHKGRGHEKRMDEIEVTANPLGTSSAEAAKPAVVLAGGELEDRRRGTIGETVSGFLPMQTAARMVSIASFRLASSLT